MKTINRALRKKDIKDEITMPRGKIVLIIEITDGEIRLLSYQKGIGFKRKNPDKYGYWSIPLAKHIFLNGILQDEVKLAEIFRNFRVEHFKGKNISAVLLLPFYNGLIREFTLPWIRPKDRASAVRYYIQEEVPVPFTELIYDYRVIEEKKDDYLKIQVTAAKKAIVNQYIKCLEEAGYKLQSIEYAVTAAGYFFNRIGLGDFIYSQDIGDGKIQFVFYKKFVPFIIRNIPEEHPDIHKYLVYLGIREFELPVEFVISDKSSFAQQFADLLVTAGLAKSRMEPDFQEEHSDIQKIVDLEGGAVFALLGSLLRIKNNLEGVNFYQNFLVHKHLKILTATAGVLACGIFLLWQLVWFPLYSEFKVFQEEKAYLNKQYAELKQSSQFLLVQEWKKLESLRLKNNMEILKEVMNCTGDQINIKRLNYKQGTLYLWASCSNNSELEVFVRDLRKSGWQEPVLTNYKYDRDGIVFCLSSKK